MRIRLNSMMTENAPHRYFIVNKPYNMLSQFISEREADLLGGINFDFPDGIHAVGRLDKNSEGLLILTTNKAVTRLLFQGETVHNRTYLVKVKNTVSEATLQQLQTGVSIRIKGGEQYTTTACQAVIIDEPQGLFASTQPFPQYPPFTWLQITLTEGKYHQIRKMTAALHHKCLRLVRVGIEDIVLDGLAPGAVRELEETAFFRLLKIQHWQGSRNNTTLAAG